MMRKALILSGIAVVLCACAESPESIAPAYVSTVTYQNWTCRQLGEEEARLHAAYTGAAQQQRNARTNDTWGVVLLGLPTASLSGENIAPQIANLKGQLDAVHQSQTLKNCSHSGASEFPLPQQYNEPDQHASLSTTLGIEGSTLTSSSIAAVNMADPHGVFVHRVSAGSPADQAGIKVGDIIQVFDGQSVSSFEELTDYVSKTKQGSILKLSIYRNGQILIMNVSR